MQCWACSRQAHGYGHLDKRHGFGDPRRYPIDWRFCSRRCQKVFHALYDNWSNALEHGLSAEATMVDATQLEKAAMHRCLKFFGEAANAIGFDKPLGAYSETQALSVIEAIVTAYVEEMTTQHERSKYPTVRIPKAKAISDPMRATAKNPSTSSSDNPFADMEDDLPWEVV